MKTAALALAAAGLLTALPAAAQYSLAAYGGWTGGGSFEQDTSDAAPIDIKSSASGALAFSFAVDGARQGQLLLSYQSTNLEASSTTPEFPLKLMYLHFGGTNYFQGAIGKGPYVAAGIGATWMSPDLSGLSSEVRPSLNLGFGYEWPLGGGLSLKAELRGWFTLVNSDSALFCSGGCVVAIKGDGFAQVQGLLGLSLAF